MPPHPRPDPAAHVAALHAIAVEASRAAAWDDLLGPALRALSDPLRFERPSVGLVDAAEGVVAIDGAHGLTPAEIRRARFRLGEGITGEVAATGRPAIVERIAEEPRFLDRNGVAARMEASFLCAPLLTEGRPIGTLSAFRPVAPAAALEADLRALQTVAALLAPAAERHLASRRAAAPVEPGFRPPNLIGQSKAMRAVYEAIAQVAPSTTTALLRGESGTGKELVARALHQHSPRARGPFVAVNCAALPESVVESELFGHERGAFTGAVQQRKGRFELADGGTLFLDEIGELSPASQGKILRVLQERAFERVGGTRTVHVDVRLVAATSRDLEAMSAAGAFREDLYWRLAVFPIHLPPLRERRGDVVLLADHFVDVFNRAHGRAVRRISTPALDLLTSYHWPGNVRELESCIERAVLLARDDVVHGHHLPPSLQAPTATATEPAGGLEAALAAVERELLVDALKATHGNIAAAARLLHVTERIMGLRLRKRGVDPRRFRVPTST
jgi:Nif-specific regulatory protein